MSKMNNIEQYDLSWILFKQTVFSSLRSQHVLTTYTYLKGLPCSACTYYLYMPEGSALFSMYVLLIHTWRVCLVQHVLTTYTCLKGLPCLACTYYLYMPEGFALFSMYLLLIHAWRVCLVLPNQGISLLQVHIASSRKYSGARECNWGGLLGK